MGRDVDNEACSFEGAMQTYRVQLHVCMLSHFSCVRLFATLWIMACQAPLAMGFSRQEHWMRCHVLFQGIFQTQG